MLEHRKAKYSEIIEWYSFRPELSFWISKRKGKNYSFKLFDETWYGGYWFNTGYFAFVQCKLFAIHILFRWWNFRKRLM